MADLKERLAGLAVSAALLGGAAPAQAQVSAPVATTTAAAPRLPSYSVQQWDSPTPQMLEEMKGLTRRFDGTRQNYDQLTQGMPTNALEQFRMIYNRQNNEQKIAAEQSAGLMFSMKDKDAFNVLNKSIAAKASGQASDPAAQIQGYLANKQTVFDRLIDKRMQESEKAKPESLKQAGDGDVQNVIAQMREGKNEQAWARSTAGWNQDSLRQLKEQAHYALQGDNQTMLQAGSNAAKVDNKQMLTLMAGVKMSDGKPESAAVNQALRLNISAVETTQHRNMNDWTQEAQKRSIEAGSAKPPEVFVQRTAGTPTGAIPSATPPSLKETQDKIAAALSEANKKADSALGKVPSDIGGPRLSNVDCKSAMNNAVQGGATVSVGRQLAVSLADIHQTAKDILDKSRPRPDLSNWSADSLKNLSRDMGQEFKNQMMSAQQAVDGIRAGGNPQTLTENITNPKIRELIVTQSKPGMSDQELTKLRTDVMAETGFADANMAVARQLSMTAQAEVMQRRVPGAQPGCVPGS